MTTFNCQVCSVDAMTDTVYRVRLVAETVFNFRAGQYLMVIIDKYDYLALSMASTPMENPLIELHIRVSETNLYAIAVMNFILKKRELTIDIPHGEAWLRDDTERPIILIAGGTGFSYTRSIMLTVLLSQPQRKLTIYWGGRDPNDLYDLDYLRNLSIQYQQLLVVPIIEQLNVNWYGRNGTILSAIMQDYSALDAFDIYIAGRFDMVKHIRDRLCKERGANNDRIFGDALMLSRV